MKKYHHEILENALVEINKSVNNTNEFKIEFESQKEAYLNIIKLINILDILSETSEGTVNNYV